MTLLRPKYWAEATPGRPVSATSAMASGRAVRRREGEKEADIAAPPVEARETRMPASRLVALKLHSKLVPHPVHAKLGDRRIFPGAGDPTINLMQAPEYTVVNRECRAVQIPEGTPALLSPGTRVRITQSLGGTYTVATDRGHLLRI